MTQHIGEGTLNIPQTWYNASINVFTAEQPGKAGPSLSVNRDLLRPGLVFADYVSDQITKLRAKLKDFRIVQERQMEVSGRPAWLYEFTWESEQGLVMHQILLSVNNDARLINLVATHGAVMEGHLKDHMMAMLLSFRFAQVGRSEVP